MASSSVVLRKNKDSLNQLPHNQSLAFQLKCGLELERLQIQLRSKLKDDLIKLQNEEVYANVILISEERRESATHSSILKARTPDFYDYITANRIFGDTQIKTELPNLRHSQIQAFLRLIYSSENIKHDEKCFLKFLQDKDKLRKRANDRIISNEDIPHNKHRDTFEVMNQDILDRNCIEPYQTEPEIVDHGELLSDIADGLQSAIVEAVCYGTSFKHEIASRVDCISNDSISYGNCSSGTNGVCAKQMDESLGIQLHDRSDDASVSHLSSCFNDVAENDTVLRDEQEVAIAFLDASCNTLAYTVENAIATAVVDYEPSAENGNEVRGGSMVATIETGHSVSSSSCTHSLPDSPADSLRKDDSLEFCPDSLASDDALLCAGSAPCGSNIIAIDQHHDLELTVSSSSPLFSDSVSVHDELKINGVRAPQIDICRSAIENESVRKRAWTLSSHDVPATNPLFVDLRRLSLSSDEFQHENVAKPSAIVTPYNATNDALKNDVDNLAHDTSSGASALSSEPLLPDDSNFFSNPAPRNEQQPRCQVQFQVVPFLKEVAVGNVQEMFYNGEQQNSIGSGDRLFQSHNAVNESAITTNEITEASGGTVSKKSIFMFIDTNNDSESHEMENTIDKSGSDEVLDVVHAEAESVSTPPPVYMFIDVASNSSAIPLKESTDTVVQRRHVGAKTLPRKRPKSESAVTLLKSIPIAEKAAKRMSQVLEINSDVVCRENEIVRSFDDETVKSRYNPCSKLGGDLLNMFLQEIDADITVRVAGRDIKAHKSVLISRCGYFAAMLSGGWVESSGNIIKLQGFSYDAVHFAMCHIYSGASSVPANVDISELASLADMFGLEGLKDVVTLYLKINYCHFFHKPCSSCTTRVSECLLIAISFGLDELQEKCLKWITKHMLRTWPTKSFAALPSDILQKCLLFAKIEVTVDTVLDVVMRCDKLTATLPRVKWTDPVLTLVAGVAEACSEFLSKNFAKILKSNSFLVLRSGETWDLHALEATFLLAVERLSLDVACRAYAHLHEQLLVIGHQEYSESSDINENFEALVRKIHRQVELLLIHNANQVAQCPGWALLSANLQKIIMDAAVIVIEFEKPTAPPPTLSSFNKRFTRSTIENKTREVLISPSAISRRLSASCSSASKTTTNHQPLKLVNNTRKTRVIEPSKDVRKSATLPRTSISKELIPTRSVLQSHARVSSTSTSNTKKENLGAAINVRGPRNVNSQPQANSSSQKRVNSATTATVGVPLSASSSSRPKSWPANKEDSKLKFTDSTSTVQLRKKTITKEPRKGTREASSISGNNKVGPSALITRPKPVNVKSNDDSLSRITKPSTTTANMRDTRGSNMRKDVKSDNNVKINSRPKSDLVASNRKIASKPTASKTGFERRSTND